MRTHTHTRARTHTHKALVSPDFGVSSTMEAGLCIPARAPSISSLACCAQAEQGTPSHHSRTHARKAKVRIVLISFCSQPATEQVHLFQSLEMTAEKMCHQAHRRCMHLLVLRTPWTDPQAQRRCMHLLVLRDPVDSTLAQPCWLFSCAAKCSAQDLL
mmetsp:Transcript_13594/g.36782  ORF Transcript_13594/g.36782 Transcript_13594/m.36782 type:complete len:158 (-) Transcript_13594:432-905(-)